MDNFTLLKELIEWIGLRPRNYSGRGMYGKECIACSPDSSESGFSAQMIESAIDKFGSDSVEVSIAIEMMKRTSTDSMGLGWVCYWPSVDWEGPTEDEFEDEDNY